MPIQTVHEEKDLMVERLDGGRARLVVVFTGIFRASGGVPRAEFVGTGNEQGRNTVLFVHDLRRTWYSASGMCGRIAALVSATHEELGQPPIITLGNSMGGYGAILASRDLPVRTVVSFAPQFSMHAEVIDEPRWRQFRPEFGPELLRGLDGIMRTASAAGTRFFVIHGCRGDERRQHRRFPVGPGIRHDLLPGMSHMIAQRMKLAGALSPYIAGALAHDDAAVTEALRPLGAHRRDPSRWSEPIRLWALNRRKCPVAAVPPRRTRRRVEKHEVES